MNDFWRTFLATLAAIAVAFFVMRHLKGKCKGCRQGRGSGQTTGNYVNPGANAGDAVQQSTATPPSSGWAGKKNWGAYQ